ncbi:TlpA family protein disulfide reductase [Desulfoplanes sp. PS50]
MTTQTKVLMTAVVFVTLVMTAVFSAPAWASEVKTLSRQDLDSMIKANAGAITIVSYWATWCSACRQEIPALNDVHATYPREEVRVIGVSFDKDTRQLDTFLKLAGIEYEIYRVPEKHRYGFKEIVALPTLVFYKKNGKKGWTNKGLMLSEQIRRTIDVFAEQN